MDMKLFQNPPAQYGEVAFFWWQGDAVTREKLLWILEQMKDRHVCGLQINYAHSDSGGRIYGLTMPSRPSPLSEEWWTLVKWFEGEAVKRGMSISLSDYTLSAPGQCSYTDELLREHPEFCGQILVMLDEAGNAPSPEHYDIRPLLDTKHGTIAAVRVPYSLNPMQPGLGHAVADKFFGEFERRMPGECGHGINFFFSDELDFRVRGLLWSDEFRSEFLRMKGYDIVPHLGDMFFDESNVTAKTRLDYNDVAVRISEREYFQPMYDWHQQRGMTFGCDHGGRGLDVTEFGDYFRTMKWNQGPGNDQPRLESNIIKNKVNSSIAHLYERPRTWLEGFHSSGWQTSSADVADAIFRNFATGQNLLSLHGLYYSTHGSMWEWAPPCNHHHMPYWSEMGELLGCTKRLSWLLTLGHHRCDVAIVYPVAAVEADAERGARAVKCAFDTGRYLYKHGIDFDFIDFESIERASITNGQLHVAGERYLSIVLPDMQAVRFGMIEKLAQFARSGGHVAVLGEVPTASDRIGTNDDMLNGLCVEICSHQPPLRDACELIDSLRVRFDPDVILPENSWFQHRVIDGEDMFMVYGVADGTECGFKANGTPIILDPFSGRRFSLSPARIEGDMIYVRMQSRFGGVMLLLFSQSDISVEPLYEGTYHDIDFTGEWQCQIEPTMDNSFGDYRLPAFNGCIGAEARTFDVYCDGIQCERGAMYSVGTYFHVYRGTADEEALRMLTAPDARFTPYRFSTRTGVLGDVGRQYSYHGLKGHISDDFIALGEKRDLNSGSNSDYSGEGPFYLLTHLRVPENCMVRFDAGSIAPEHIWLDHELADTQPRMLSAGLHTLLIKYTCGCRTHFIALREDIAPAESHEPLTMSWHGDPRVIPFDAMPERDGCKCELRFTAPPGFTALRLPTGACSTVTADGIELKLRDGLYQAPNALPRHAQISIRLHEHDGLHGAALLDGPVLFNCGIGIIRADAPIEEQGLAHYSGGVRYMRSFDIDSVSSRVRLRLGDIDCSATVLVNGKPAGVLVTPPYDLDISDLLHPGKNDIEVLIHNTLANHMRTIPTSFLHERGWRGSKE